MDKDLIVDYQTIEEFIDNFFSSPYIAGWLGIFVPQIYDLREYVLNRPFFANLKLLKMLFPENLPELYEKNLDEIVSVKDISKLVHFTLIDFDNIRNFKEQRGEVFYLELIFQLPFPRNSKFKKNDKIEFIKDRKDRYDSTFRQNLRGNLIIERSSDKKYLLDREKTFFKIILKDVKEGQKLYNIYLGRPKKLSKYWSKFIRETFLSL
ncbi:MAG: hypothetical protein N2999_05460 [Proteobacteria bacterium]|nr:hypothetical protein [Pseudomonadota bacterium]